MSVEEDLEPLIEKRQDNDSRRSSSRKKDDENMDVPSVGYYKLVSFWKRCTGFLAMWCIQKWMQGRTQGGGWVKAPP